MESYILKIISDKRYLGNPVGNKTGIISIDERVDEKKQVPGAHNPELKCEIFLLES